MNVYHLHCFAQSGNAYKVALMLEVSGADWKPVWVDFFSGAARTEAFRDSVNSLGEIPVLDHEGSRLSQSGVILDYLAESLGKYGWHDDTERREILRWMLFDNHKLTSYTATLRFMRQFLKTGETEVTAFLEGRAKSSYGILNKHLENSDYALGSRPTIADFSMCGYLFWPEEIGIEFSPYPALLRWLDRIRALPNWKPPYELMPGHPLPRT